MTMTLPVLDTGAQILAHAKKELSEKWPMMCEASTLSTIQHYIQLVSYDTSELTDTDKAMLCYHRIAINGGIKRGYK